MMDQEYLEELRTRRKRFRRKLIRSGITILIGFASMVVAGTAHRPLAEAGLSEAGISFFQFVFKIIYVVCTLVGVCSFVKSLHDPLTPKEAEELEKREIAEKTGNKEDL